MPPETIRASVALIKGVNEELATLRLFVQREIGDQSLGRDQRGRLARLLAASELTYLLRLFAAFEAGLFDLGPYLPHPYHFPTAAGLGEKIQKVGSEMRMPQTFRDTVDRDVRELRNELQHGRSLLPRLSFEEVYDLMRQFYRGCR